MNKEEFLSDLARRVSENEITREEVLARIHIDVSGENSPKDTKKQFHFSVTKMLYVLGAAIAVIGILIFVGQIWDDIGSIGRITVTLGLGLLLTANGSMLLKKKPDEYIGPIFHFIGGMLVPGGALVTLNELGPNVVTLSSATIAFGAIFTFYIALSVIHKHPVLTFFAIANGTAFIYLLFELVMEGPAYMHEDQYAYLTIVVGASYLLLAHAFHVDWNKKLIGALHFFGSAGVLGAAFSQIFDSRVWEFSYLFLVVAGFYLSVYMKSKIILVLSTVSLISYVVYITAEYFADSLGWPISLVVLGFIMIGIAYGAVNAGKKYFGHEKTE